MQASFVKKGNQSFYPPREEENLAIGNETTCCGEEIILSETTKQPICSGCGKKAYPRGLM